MPILLLACSAHKHRHLLEAPAKEIYVGTLFRAGMQWAMENNYQVLILSAKYGWITPDTVIQSYNQKRTSSKVEYWPQGEGFYLGGSLYFGEAPESFKPLVPANSVGLMTSAVLKLLQDRSKVKGGMRKQKEHGVTWWLTEWLKTGKHTKAELRALLWKQFPNGHPKMDKTVDIQLTQRRIGDERNCWLRHEGEVYWLEPK